MRLDMSIFEILPVKNKKPVLSGACIKWR